MIKIENMKQIEDVVWQQKALQSRLNDPGKYTAIGENVEETIKSLMGWLNTNVAYRIEKTPIKPRKKRRSTALSDGIKHEVRYLMRKHGLTYNEAQAMAEDIRSEIRALGIHVASSERMEVLAEFGIPPGMLIYFTD